MSALLSFRESIPLSLYIHLPWCVRKCPYCDFNSHESGTVEAREMAYVDALVSDLDTSLPEIWGRRIHSIFIGGGTPSLFSPAALERLLQACQARLNPYPDTEITLEANPGTAEAKKFRDYRALGINRLSLGIQSFSDTCLQKIGRIHDAREARAAIEMAHTAGFAEINLDLMYGLPGQSLEDAMGDLETAIDFQPQHLSWYQLTLEPNTVFAARPPPLPGEDLVFNMQERGQDLLQDHGYQRYEVSAWSRPDGQCRHNLNYWQFGDYLGIGAGAHSKITDVARGTVSRMTRHRIPERYIDLAGEPGV
ncbi:MAG: radical SAM family heme chaperone HemW, partial [Gammaproteobacteria bacterium]|nr:radical SAM family heme chaperone HemW [Gammaproteobacteria bacterium]